MKDALRNLNMRFYILIVVLTSLCMTMMVRPSVSDDLAKISPRSLGSLNNFQAALYADCVMTGAAGALPAITNASQLNILSYNSHFDNVAMAQFKSLTALQRLTPVQLGCLTHETVRNYAHQTFSTGQKTLEALASFLTKTPASCLAIASRFTPADAQKISATCRLP